eukprot:3017448-Rhodomonas_salina.1
MSAEEQHPEVLVNFSNLRKSIHALVFGLSSAEKIQNIGQRIETIKQLCRAATHTQYTQQEDTGAGAR